MRESIERTAARNLLNILQSIEVAFIFPFSLSSRSKVRARCKYGARCPSLQQAVCESPITKNSIKKELNALVHDKTSLSCKRLHVTDTNHAPQDYIFLVVAIQKLHQRPWLTIPSRKGRPYAPVSPIQIPSGQKSNY